MKNCLAASLMVITQRMSKTALKTVNVVKRNVFQQFWLMEVVRMCSLYRLSNPKYSICHFNIYRLHCSWIIYIHFFGKKRTYFLDFKLLSNWQVLNCVQCLFCLCPNSAVNTDYILDLFEFFMLRLMLFSFKVVLCLLMRLIYHL